MDKLNKIYNPIAARLSFSDEELRKKLSGYYVVRSHAVDADPCAVITDLSEEEGQKIAQKNDPIKGVDNYRVRLKTENWLRSNAERSAVDLSKNTPTYFAFTNDPDAIVAHTRKHAPHKETIVIPVDQLDLSSWSFTMDDHFFASFTDGEEECTIGPSHAKSHPLHRHVLNAAQLVLALDAFGYPENPHDNNFEAQMWSSEPKRLTQDEKPDAIPQKKRHKSNKSGNSL
jgi:hypothetical protein